MKTPIIVAGVCLAVASFGLGLYFGGGNGGSPPEPSSRAPVVYVRPGSVLSDLDLDREIFEGVGRHKEARLRALALMIGPERVGARGLLAGHETLSRPLLSGRGEVVADVFWELGRQGATLEIVPTERMAWFSELSGVIFDRALEVAKRNDADIDRREWLEGFLVPVRVHGYGLLLARFAWHTRSGRTGELFARPTPAMELFKPVDEQRVERQIAAYELLVRWLERDCKRDE